jgi:hypothetical protein
MNLTDKQHHDLSVMIYNMGGPVLSIADTDKIASIVLGKQIEGADRRYLVFSHADRKGGMADMVASFSDAETAQEYAKVKCTCVAYIYDRLLGKEIWRNF